MNDIRPMLAEAVRALAALALFLLALSHAPLAVAAGDGVWASYDAGYCGTAPADRQAHAPCEACRIAGGADLQPPCALVVGVGFESSATAYRLEPAEATAGLPRVRPEGRAPPPA